jgi:hypothetical protein
MLASFCWIPGVPEMAEAQRLRVLQPSYFIQKGNLI